MTSEIAQLALGSNLGDRKAIIESAIRSLDQSDRVSVIAQSAIRETEPVGPKGQGPYLNAAVAVRTDLSPRELLARCLAIEAAHGRVRDGLTRWGPRLLDIDLLLYGDQIIDAPGLRVPHPLMHERLFVLGPLSEIAATLTHPVLGLTIQSLRDRLGNPPLAEYPTVGSCFNT